MRKLVVSAAAVAVALVPAALFGPDAFAKSSSPPVKIPGKVTVHGTGTATVTVKNTGTAQHTFTVPSANIDVTVNPGQTMVETVPISQAGIGFYCRFHKSLGMQGAFFTKNGAKVSTSGASTKSSTGSGGSSGGGSGGYGY